MKYLIELNLSKKYFLFLYMKFNYQKYSAVYKVPHSPPLGGDDQIIWERISSSEDEKVI